MLINFVAYAVGIPILAGLICVFIPERMKILAKIMAFVVSLSSFIASILIFIRKPLYWPPIAVPVFIIDNLSALAGLGISFFALVVTVYSFGFMEKREGRYFGYILMTLGSALGAAFANDLIILVVFWGFLAALLYLLVSIQGTTKAANSAKKALIIIGGTDALMIFAIGLMWKISGTFAMDSMRINLNSAFSYIAYICLAIASFAKAGAIPFHSWLPDVAEDAPPPVSAYLPASLDKLLGIYLLAKASLSLFVMNNITNTMLLIIGAISVIFASGIALFQQDFKRLLGYCAVSQVGYIAIGIGTATPIGIAGGLFHMLNHAIYKSCLFLSAGAVEKRTHTMDLSKLGGLAKYMPVTFICFIIASLSISGIPPFNGFVSKWMIYQAIIDLGSNKNPLWVLWLVAAMFGSALTMAGFIKLLHAVFLGRKSESAAGVKEVGILMALPMIILAAICVIFGIFAFMLPLPIFILPAIGKETIAYSGVWNPSGATGLILLGVLAGALIYLLLLPKKARSVGVFIGGENVDNIGRVTGAEFYDTIKDSKLLRFIYKKEEAKYFDIYDIGRNSISIFTKYLQKLHNGVLPTYLIWCLLGMIGMLIILFLKVAS